MLRQAYWVKGNHFVEVMSDRHIDFVVRYPEKFGLTKEKVEAVYKKHKEKVGIEGTAREELIKMAADSGWVRIRHYSRPDFWSVQFDNWRKRQKAVRSFIESAVFDKKIMTRHDEVRFHGYRDGYNKSYSFMDGGVIVFLKERKAKKNRVSKDILPDFLKDER